MKQNEKIFFLLKELSWVGEAAQRILLEQYGIEAEGYCGDDPREDDEPIKTLFGIYHTSLCAYSEVVPKTCGYLPWHEYEEYLNKHGVGAK